MNISRVKRLRGIHVAAAAILILVVGAGCDFIAVGEARQALETGREVRQMEEELRPLEDELESLRMTEMEPRYRETEDLHNQIRRIEEEVLEPLRRSFDGHSPEMDDLQREFEAAQQVLYEAGRELEIERRNLEAQFRADESAIRDEMDTVIPAAEARRDTVQSQLNDLYRYGWDEIEALNRQIEDLRRELGNYPPDSEEHAALVATISALESDKASQEQNLRSRIDALEDDLWAINDRLQELYRTYQQRMEYLQDVFTADMRTIEDRRLALDDQRWALEDERRVREEALKAELRAREEEIRNQITAIVEGQIRPLKERISEVEDELHALHERERTLKGQLVAARSEFEPKARELEDQMFDLLESAVNAAEGAANAEGR